ncbi:unnamed protein product [Orchesella dallaii]|uniref:C2H2-type domain-containing protein n=2 Tax=Orchesella dallaii TaxID=48710 RepID=A0ABP1QK00_9HEXA
MSKSAPTRAGQGSSKLTFAPSVSACWNNSLPPATSTPTMIPVISSPSLQQQRKTTCLFCPNIVVLPMQQGERNKKLEKFIGNLCKHFKIQRSELPGQCSKEMFPFCAGTCEPLVMKLWRQEGALHAILQLIDETVTKIERVVADGEFLGNYGGLPCSSSMARIEQLKVTKLRDIILTSCKEKFCRRLNIEETPNKEENYEQEIENQDQGNTTENWANDVEFHYDANEGTNTSVNMEINVHETQLVDMKQEYIEQLRDVTISVADPRSAQNSVEDNYSQDEHHHLNFNSPPHQEHENEFYSHEEQEYQDEHDSAAEVEDQDLTADPNVVSHALVIANENDETGVTSVIQIIKQEALGPGTNAYEPEDGEVYALANRKRRCLYEGIEIFRASGTGRFASINYLQCGECCYTVSLPKNTSRLASRYTIIKTHILHAHKKKTGAPKRSRQREYVCAVCTKTFLNTKQLREHKATHTPDEIVKCDICMKPMSGTISVYNFLAHKFSHKNDEERRIAFANGERGASACLLSTRKNQVRCSTEISKRVQTKSVRRQVNQPKQTQRNNNANKYCCELCNRTFARKCHLARHKMSQHLKPQ